MIIEIICLVLAIPVGFWIAWEANDELKEGRKWFVWIIFLGLIVGIFASLMGEWAVVWTLWFIVITTGISYLKSFDKKWCKRRI